MVISILKIRRPLGRLIFNMGIAIPGKTVFLIETAPWSPKTQKYAGYIIVALSFLGFIFLHDIFSNMFIIHSSEIKVMLRLYMFSNFDNTLMITMFINNSDKAISRMKIVWNIIFKADIHGYTREMIISWSFRGEKRFDGFPELFIFTPPAQCSLK